jgi:hypothetical protein
MPATTYIAEKEVINYGGQPYGHHRDRGRYEPKYYWYYSSIWFLEI